MAKGILRKQFFEAGGTLSEYFGVNSVWETEKRKSESRKRAKENLRKDSDL